MPIAVGRRLKWWSSFGSNSSSVVVLVLACSRIHSSPDRGKSAVGMVGVGDGASTMKARRCHDSATVHSKAVTSSPKVRDAPMVPIGTHETRHCRDGTSRTFGGGGQVEEDKERKKIERPVIEREESVERIVPAAEFGVEIVAAVGVDDEKPSPVDGDWIARVVVVVARTVPATAQTTC